MNFVNKISDTIFSQSEKSGFHIAGVLFLVLTVRAVVQLKKTNRIINFFKAPKTIGQLLLIILWVYLVYVYVNKHKHSKDPNIVDNVTKLQNATKKAFLALLIAFFASIDLVIAPFWLIWVIAYYLEDWV